MSFALLVSAISAAPFTDADARNYRERVIAAGSSLSEGNYRAVITLFKALKAANVWNKITAGCLFAGPGSLAGAMVPIKDGMVAPTGVNLVSGDWSRTAGIKGDRASKCVDTNYASSSIPQDNQTALIWLSEADSQQIVNPTAGYLDSAAPNGRDTLAAFQGSLQCRSQNSAAVAGQTVTGGAGTALGMMGLFRNNNANYTVAYGVASSQVITQASEARTAATIVLLAAGSKSAAFSDGRIGLYMFGEYIPHTTLRPILTAYMGALT